MDSKNLFTINYETSSLKTKEQEVRNFDSLEKEFLEDFKDIRSAGEIVYQ